MNVCLSKRSEAFWKLAHSRPNLRSADHWSRTSLIARRLDSAKSSDVAMLLYKGPCRELRISDDIVLKKGHFVKLPRSIAEELVAENATLFVMI